MTQQLLDRLNISSDDVLPIIGDMVSSGVEFSDVYFQSVISEMWLLEEGIVKEGSFDIESGFGVRAVQGEKSGYAHADMIDLSNIKKAAQSAASIVKAGKNLITPLPALRADGSHKSLPRTRSGGSGENLPKHYYPGINPISSLSEQEKVALLHQADQIARAEDPRVQEVVVSLSGEFEEVAIINSEGRLATDIRPLIRFNVSVIVEQNGRRESGNSGGGRRMDYTYFTDENKIEYFAKEAVRVALVNLEAVPTPAGEMPVVLGPGWPGVLLHEAVGHGLEGDFNRKGASVFTNRIGEQVATPLCTVVDDGTVENRRGSISIDDEGTPSECTVLIENGILRHYMHDRLNAKLMNARSTGNGRRESYANLPIPRMRNTYMRSGESDPAEIIASVKRGLYAVNFAGGQVDITSGSFVFSMSEAYMIEDGKISHPVKDATLIGQGVDVLKKVSMVGNDLQLDEGVGTCGKDGQGVPVGVGQPTLKVDSLTVGGTTTG